MGLPVGGLNVPGQLAVQFQLVGLPDAVAVSWTQTPSHQGDGDPAVIVGVPGFGLIVSEILPALGEEPQLFVAETVMLQVCWSFTDGAV